MEYIRQSSLSKIWKLCDNMGNMDNTNETRKQKFGIEMGLNAQLDEIAKVRDKLKLERELLELAEKTAKENAELEKLWFIELPRFCEDYIETAKLEPALGKPHPNFGHRPGVYQYKKGSDINCFRSGRLGIDLFKTRTEAVSALEHEFNRMKEEFEELSDIMQVFRNNDGCDE